MTFSLSVSLVGYHTQHAEYKQYTECKSLLLFDETFLEILTVTSINKDYYSWGLYFIE